jgi:hypothetical protein
VQHILDRQYKKKPARPRSHRDGNRLVSGILLILPPSLAWALGRGACLAPSDARHRALVCSDRYSAESVWPLVPTPAHEVLTQFNLVKKRKSVNKQGDMNSTRRTQFKKRETTLLRRRVLPQHTFGFFLCRHTVSLSSCCRLAAVRVPWPCVLCRDMV